MNVHPCPFPHLVVRDWFTPALLRAARDEFPLANDARWRQYGNDHERKLEGPPETWGPATTQYFAELADLTSILEHGFGIPGLHMETIGGGYHLIPPGGYLDVHSDFSLSPTSGRYRRLNVLTFLNDAWRDDDGGHLELWGADGPSVVIAPEFGTTVAFATSATSWHGHPQPTKRWRASLAAYFFTIDPPPGYREQSTVWHPEGGRH